MEIIDKLEDHALEVLAAAYLKSQNLSADKALEILKENGIIMSEPTFSRRVAEAEDKNWLLHVVPEDLFSSGVMREVREMTCRRGLESSLKKLCPALRNVSVYSSGSEGTTPEHWHARLKHHSLHAARRVHRLLEEAESVAVGWGHQIESIVYGLESLNMKALKHTVTFIPSSGEPLKGPVSRPDRASSALVARLHRLFGNQLMQPLSLAGVVAVILDRYGGIAREALLEYISDISDFRTIFLGTEGAAPLIRDADSVIASVGSLDQGWTLYKSWFTRTEGTPREELVKWVEGDVCGAFVKKHGLLQKDEEAFSRLDNSWTGIKLADILHIATKARTTGKPGVIVVAIGENKAKILFEVLRLGLVNELIIDHDLANALSNRYLS